MYTIQQIKSTLPELESHPAANKFPLMPKEKFEALKFDLITNGMVAPIWIAEGKILDGRSRYAALLWLKKNKQLFFETDIREWVDPESNMDSVVRSLNVHRNNYTKQQLAVYAVRYLVPNLKEEAKQRMYKQVPMELFPDVKKGNANHLAAIQVGTNEKYVQYACHIYQCNNSFLDFVMNKQMTLQEGMVFIKMKMEIREHIFDQMKNGMKFKQAKEIIQSKMKQVKSAESKEPELNKYLPVLFKNSADQKSKTSNAVDHQIQKDHLQSRSKKESVDSDQKNYTTHVKRFEEDEIAPVHGIICSRVIPHYVFEEIKQILHNHGYSNDNYKVLYTTHFDLHGTSDETDLTQ